ncbi:hypothetical protein [Streptomyces sp. ALI-76-A]|uniref:hypothetical protein n=1 Tax=Streptomyces sp. ALI-76-A TaxID=3025736 RepID=UPI00256EC2C7|nr:hypothetical protein [Streptomyces sp. ALI-76-A]MDL5199252.1 hypothetical protein [Streptomyces sp. ALI-76-A]
MVIVACLLLPSVGVMLYGMILVEDWLARTSQPPRHARARHLRLIQGGGQGSGAHARTGRRGADAA